jgi:hypothetical protein
MTTGQPIRFQSDRNKYNNEYMEALQLQINLNQNNLEVNRLYKETGQLPASTQMMDNRSNEEKLADTYSLKQSIISDLAPIAEPMFASAVIQGVIDSPLNVNNSLFKYLAQNASVFAQTLSKKYKFGIAGDANDIAIMIQFLEDAYNKTKNTFQSIKGYINSNTNEGNKSRSNILSANDTDNLIIELKDILKRLESLGIGYNNYPINIVTNITTIQDLIVDILQFLPSSDQMREIIDLITAQQAETWNPQIGNPYDPRVIAFGQLGQNGIATAVLKILSASLPKLSSVQTIIDRLFRAVSENDQRIIQQSTVSLVNLFANFNTPENRAIMNQFKDEYMNRANNMIQTKVRENEINYANQMRIDNANDAAVKKSQRVYVINPANDPVHIIGNMNLGAGGGYGGYGGGGDGGGGDGGDGGDGSIVSGLSYNLPFGNSQQGDGSIYSGVSGHMQQRQDDYENAADNIDNVNKNNPAGYARDMGQLNAQYQDLDGYGILRDPQDHPVYGRAPVLSIPTPPSKKAPSAPSKKAPSVQSSTTSTASSIYDPTPISGSNDYLSNAVSSVASLLGLKGPSQGRNYDIETKVKKLSKAQVEELYNRLHYDDGSLDNNGKRDALIDTLKDTQDYDPRSAPRFGASFNGLGLKPKPVKKGRGLYSPFGDSEINHKNLENNILTLRRKSKTNYMDLPSKHISKHMKNIIHNIVGGKIANFEDMHNLTDEERNYLSKVVKKSNLQDRLSVPAPSKDQADKDNHQWEVMRGEIMAGNDSHELVKKFKILTMKLTRQGLLPKNEVMDLFQDLIDLGY